ncbi:hypothetical protein BCR43DRAFT_503832 [Syncephalastrum racemosum]|uniref:F-box domain-containing protein n=1 Tax=Syncephalastrum racemosum TaxID=13706 RepID=A0A1X2HJ62_SYNRA|nr:hypothetical protein BCR43DRAFT_503832 [Syncephalastrum racemosum]
MSDSYVTQELQVSKSYRHYLSIADNVMKLFPGDPDAYLLAGTMYSFLSYDKRAVQCYQAGLNLGAPPSDDLKSEYIAALQRRNRKVDPLDILPDDIFIEVFKLIPESRVNCLTLSRRWRGLLPHLPIWQSIGVSMVGKSPFGGASRIGLDSVLHPHLKELRLRISSPAACHLESILGSKAREKNHIRLRKLYIVDMKTDISPTDAIHWPRLYRNLPNIFHLAAPVLTHLTYFRICSPDITTTVILVVLRACPSLVLFSCPPLTPHVIKDSMHAGAVQGGLLRPCLPIHPDLRLLQAPFHNEANFWECLLGMLPSLGTLILCCKPNKPMPENAAIKLLLKSQVETRISHLHFLTRAKSDKDLDALLLQPGEPGLTLKSLCFDENLRQVERVDIRLAGAMHASHEDLISLDCIFSLLYLYGHSFPRDDFRSLRTLRVSGMALASAYAGASAIYLARVVVPTISKLSTNLTNLELISVRSNLADILKAVTRLPHLTSLVLKQCDFIAVASRARDITSPEYRAILKTLAIEISCSDPWRKGCPRCTLNLAHILVACGKLSELRVLKLMNSSQEKSHYSEHILRPMVQRFIADICASGAIKSLEKIVIASLSRNTEDYIRQNLVNVCLRPVRFNKERE